MFVPVDIVSQRLMVQGQGSREVAHTARSLVQDIYMAQVSLNASKERLASHEPNRGLRDFIKDIRSQS